MTNPLKGQYLKVHVDTIQHPPDAGMLHHWRDRWWAVTEDSCVLMYEGKWPICNTNPEVVDKLIKINLEHCKVIGKILIKNAFWPLDLKDYA